MLKMERVLRHYDFAEVMVGNMKHYFKNYSVESKFKYSFILVHLLLHQNFEWLGRNVLVSRIDERGYIQPIFVCTPVFSRT